MPSRFAAHSPVSIDLRPGVAMHSQMQSSFSANWIAAITERRPGCGHEIMDTVRFIASSCVVSNIYFLFFEERRPPFHTLLNGPRTSVRSSFASPPWRPSPGSDSLRQSPSRHPFLLRHQTPIRTLGLLSKDSGKQDTAQHGVLYSLPSIQRAHAQQSSLAKLSSLAM